DWSSVSVGANHTVAIKSDGVVWSWGKNTLGQLGNGTTTNQSASIQLGTDNNWSSIDAGINFTSTIKNDGTLWAWGDNAYGQLGDGTTIYVPSPKKIGVDNNWSSVSAGLYHTVTLKTDGTLWAWGRNLYGQLGDTTTTDSASPTQIGSDTTWTSVVASNHTMALKTEPVDGNVTLWAWGLNDSGQLGDTTTTNATSPTLIPSDINWTSVSTGAGHTVAIKSDGTLWTWGDNAYSQLGDGNTIDVTSPTQIGTATNWSNVSAGLYHTSAIKTDGTLWAWGYNGFGQLGDSSITDVTSPKQIGTATNWSNVSAGRHSTVALKSDNTLWAWGDNGSGQLSGGTTAQFLSPTQIGIANNWKSITSGWQHTVALKSDNTLWNWGLNTGLVVSPTKIGGSISPSSADAPFTIDEDTSKTFASADFSFNDTDAADSLQSIFITTLTNAGTLKLNGTDVVLNQEINTSDISGLVFAPLANANGTPYATFSFKVNDGNTSSPLSYSIGMSVNAIADAPTSANAAFTINEDTGKRFASSDFIFNDVDTGDTLKSIFITTLTTAGTLQLNGTDVILNQEISTSDISGLIFTPAVNANGTPYATFGFTVSDGSLSSIAYTAFINVIAVDDVPVLAAIANVSTLEDFADSKIILYGYDVDSAIVYSASSSNTKIATVSIVSGKLVVSQIENAYGLVKITVTITSSGKTASQTFEFDIASVNDIPSIDTVLSDLTILEDAQSFRLDMNISDVEGDVLSVVVASDDATILSVQQNFNTSLTFGEYSGIPLNFTLTAPKDANGVATISVTLNDGLATTTRYFNVNITPVNDAPQLEPISNVIVFKNFVDKNITLSATDVEGDSLTYSATIVDDTLISGISFNANTMTISSINGAVGSTDINVTVTDGQDSNSQIVKLNIIAFTLGDNVEGTGEIKVVQEETSVTTKLILSDTLSLQIKENNDGTSSQEIQVAGTTVKTISTLPGTSTEFTTTGIKVSYSGLDLSLEVISTIKGVTSFTLQVNDLITKAISEFIGALTEITRNSNGEISIETSVRVNANSFVSVKTTEGGTTQSNVRNGTTTTKVISSIAGSTPTIKETGLVEMLAGSVNLNGDYETRVLVSTFPNGETTAQFIKASKTNPTNSSIVDSLLREGSRLPSGSEIEIFELNNVLFIKVSTKLNKNLQI
ncbi:hypothetical protein JHD49_04150, partial [Sulfurimonas sp. SAG-AH-194-C21]